ncbi:hypothetical protein Tco_0195959 [Tanacetum coccineum]
MAMATATAVGLGRTGNHLTKKIAMTTLDLNETHTHPCLSNHNPAEPKSDKSVKMEISTELIMKLRNNTYNGAEANDAIDHITRSLQIINLVKTPNVNTEQLCILTFPYSLTGEAHRWWVQEGNSKITSWGYDNDTLINDEESSDDENNELAQHPFFDPYQNDKEMGDKSPQKECKDNANKPKNFDATHSDVKERQDEGMCKVDIFEMIKYLIGDNEEFMGIRTLERHSWAQTVNGVSSIYLDIFHKKDEG